MTRQLPLLLDREKALENCAYCPKLCRSVCPVSNAEPRESFTPWGKMTMAWLTHRGDAPTDSEHSGIAWACSGCHACQKWCEHDNPVFQTLLAARADAVAKGVAPASVARVLAGHARRARVTRERVELVTSELGLPGRSHQALLVGCGYFLEFPDTARLLVSAVQKLVGDFLLIDECCGAVLAYAGDRLGQDIARARFEKKLAGVERVIVHDPGCAMQLSGYPIETVVSLADRERAALARLPASRAAAPMRWHDPCQLGRGLGQTEEPRRVLHRLLGRVPEEFRSKGAAARCSGGGALLPSTLPEVSRIMAQERLKEHESSGGGAVVTACASSLRRFRRSGAEVIDIAELIAEGVDPS